MKMTEFERFKEILRNHDVSVTTARSRIFSTLLKTSQPLKKGEIAARTPEVNRASVYRALDLFDRLGITTTMVRGWTPFVELAEPFKPHHHHLLCTSCHQLIALDNAELEQIIQTLAASHGYELSLHHIELEGLCPRCQATAVS